MEDNISNSSLSTGGTACRRRPITVLACLLVWCTAVMPAEGQPQCEQSEIAEFIAGDSATGDRFGGAVGVSGTVVVVGAPQDDHGAVENAGSAYFYRQEGNTWQEFKVLSSDYHSGDNFGDALDIRGDTAVIGAPGAEAAYVFQEGTGQWLETRRLQAGDGMSGDEFGNAVGLFGDVVVVGARSADVGDTNTGSAYVYRFDGADWIEEAQLMPPDAGALDYFGTAVAIWDDVIVIGASYDDDNGSNSGSAYVFRRDPSNCPQAMCPWRWEAKLLPEGDGDLAGDFFGFDLAVAQDVIVVGARKHQHGGLPQSGAAYLFRHQGGGWQQEAKLTAFDAEAFDQFGYAVDISDNARRVAVGAKGADNGILCPDAGAVYLFRRLGNQWVLESLHLAEEPYWDDWLGGAVAIADQLLVAGAEGTDLYEETGFFSGSAFVFPAGCGSCLADINEDGVVNGPDLAALLGAWGPNPGHPADFNGDGAVTAHDLPVLLGSWGFCD